MCRRVSRWLGTNNVRLPSQPPAQLLDLIFGVEKIRTFTPVIFFHGSVYRIHPVLIRDYDPLAGFSTTVLHPLWIAFTLGVHPQRTVCSTQKLLSMSFERDAHWSRSAAAIHNLEKWSFSIS